MALISPAAAESVRDHIRKLRLPRAWNILLFGFDNEIPKEELQPDAEIPYETEAAVPEKVQPKRRGPKPHAVRISYEDIGIRLDEWCGRYREFPAEVTIDRIAEETGLYKSHLLKYFQFGIEKDFRMWKLEQKIACSQRLLLDHPDMQVFDVAIRCGFNNTSNFFRQFKRLTGETPQEWRLNQLNP